MAFIPAYSIVSAESAAPQAYALVLHGILGSGGNWRTVARKLAQARPEWGFALVDLREHGRSGGAPPPHTVAAAAADLDGVVAELSDAAPVRAILAHSFGGKVALAFRDRGAAPLLQTWIADASPSARPEALTERPDVLRVLELLESLPARFSDREAFVRAVTDRGFSAMLGKWLAMNLEPRGGEVELGLDLGAIRALLTDYFERDAWPEVEREGAPGELRFVLGDRSDAVEEEARARLDALANERPTTLRAHHLDAGHWLHVEALGPLVDLLAEELAAP